jgi:hypothetical protein
MEGSRFSPRATAFFVTYIQKQHFWRFVVTAEHVVSGLLSLGQKIFIRVNLVNGDVVEMQVPGRWVCYSNEGNSSDVAVHPFPTENTVTLDNGRIVELDILSVALNGPMGIAATPEVMRERQIGVGEEIFIIGLFRSHYGKQQNVPIVRTGNIAAMTGEPIMTVFCGYIDAYLIEARSVGGLSGSPVFVHPPHFRRINGRIQEETGRPEMQLLGLMHGHFDVSDLNADVVVDSERKATTGIHTGIGVVIPVEKIIATVEDPDLVSERERMIEKLRQESGVVPDSLSPLPVPGV